jgi:Carboxypeptidase regulatory-like domain
MRLAASLLCLALLQQTVQPPRDGAAPAQKTGTGIIKGRVLAGDTDSGVASATVYLVVPGPTSPPRAVLTDRTGRYVIDKLRAGTYRLSALPPDNTARLLGTDEASRPIDVDEGATITVPDMRLPFGAAVSGRVVDERGEPLANVEVYAMGPRFGIPKSRIGPPFPLRTDDQGRFRLFGLPAGDVVVVAEAQGVGYGIGEIDRPAGFVPTYYPDAVSDAEAKHITLRQGADIDGIDIRMTRMRTFRITGTVIDSRGLPFAGAKLGLHHLVNGHGGTHPVTVGADGRFEIRSVLPGAYRLVAGMREGPFDRSASTEHASVPVDVADDNVEDLVVTTKPSADLTVRVVFEPEAPAAVPENFGLVAWGGGELGFSVPQAPLSADSTVVLKGAAGPLVLRPMSGPVRSAWFLKGVYLGTRDITDTPTEFAPADATRVRVVFTSRAATVTGTVTDEAGKPTRDYGVVLFPEDRAEWIEHSSGILTSTPEKNGDYKINGVRAGRYRVAAIDRKALNRMYFDRFAFLESLAKESIAITVTENEQRVVDLKRGG